MQYLSDNKQNDYFLFVVEYQMVFIATITEFQHCFNSQYINLQVFDLFNLKYLDQPHFLTTK